MTRDIGCLRQAALKIQSEKQVFQHFRGYGACIAAFLSARLGSERWVGVPQSGGTAAMGGPLRL